MWPVLLNSLLLLGAFLPADPPPKDKPPAPLSEANKDKIKKLVLSLGDEDPKVRVKVVWVSSWFDLLLRLSTYCPTT